VAPGTAPQGMGAEVPGPWQRSAASRRPRNRLLFAEALGALTQITDAAFAEYRADPGMVADMRHRFAQWRRELLSADSRLEH
jgi:hypothetical protein